MIPFEIKKQIADEIFEYLEDCSGEVWWLKGSIEEWLEKQEAYIPETTSEIAQRWPSNHPNYQGVKIIIDPDCPKDEIRVKSGSQLVRLKL